MHEQELLDCDEDTLILPDCMLKELKINEGDPICLTIDKNIINY
jgi:antitoxin component of MazEF toxin-antitoxin module